MTVQRSSAPADERLQAFWLMQKCHGVVAMTGVSGISDGAW
jgi:hypothetical protein